MTADISNEQTNPNEQVGKTIPPVRSAPSVAKPAKPIVGQASATSIAAVTSALPDIRHAAIAAARPAASKASAPVAATVAPEAISPTPRGSTEPNAAMTTTEATRASTTEIPETQKVTKDITMSTTEEFINHGQANVEAVMKSGQIWATGMQDLGRTFVESAQAQFDHTMATLKALAGTKSVKEAFDIQSTRARASLEKVVADTGRLTDASMKLAEQAMAPITARLTVATEKFGAIEKFARPN